MLFIFSQVKLLRKIIQFEQHNRQVLTNLNKYYMELVVTYQCHLDTNPYDPSARKLFQVHTGLSTDNNSKII